MERWKKAQLLAEMRTQLAELALIESSTGAGTGGHNHTRGADLCPVCQRRSRLVPARY